MLLGLLLLAAALIWGRLESRHATEALERSRLAVQAQAIEQNLARQLTGVYAALKDTRADLLNWPDAIRASRTHSRLEALCASMPGLYAMQWLGADGRVRASNRIDAVGRDDAAQPYFATLRARPDPGVLFVSEPYRSQAGVQALNLSVVVVDARGHFDGALSVTIDPDYFDTLLGSVVYASDMRTAVIHGRGAVLVLNPAPPIGASGANGAGLNVAGPGTMFSQHLASKQPASVLIGRSWVTDDIRMAALRALKPAALPMDEALVVSVSRNLDAIYADWLRQTELVAALFLAFALAAGVACVVWQRQRRSLARMAAERQSHAMADAERLELALRGGDLALWDAHLPSGQGTVNARWYEMVGYRASDLPSNQAGWEALVHPEDLPRVLALQNDHVQGLSPSYEAQYRLLHRAGHWVWVLDRGRVVERDSYGVAVRMVGTHMDVTARVAVEEALRRTEARLRMAGRLARLGDWRYDLPTQQLSLSADVRAMLGMAGSEAISGQAGLDFMAPEHRRRWRKRMAQALQDGLPFGDEFDMRTPSGRMRRLQLLGEAVRDSGGAIVALQGALQDVTEARQAQEQLRLLEAAVAGLEDMVLITAAQPLGEPGPPIVFVNDAFVRVTGWRRDEVLGRSPRLLHGPQTDRVTAARVEASLARGEPVRAEMVNYTREGQPYWVDIALAPLLDAAGRPTHVVSVHRDISERRQAEADRRALERQLREAQKMESIGTLAGGIAHDFNNILAAILGNVALASADLPVHHHARVSLEQIQKSSLRARSLVQQILTFSRRQLNPLVVQVLRPVIDETLALLRATLPASVRLDTALADGPLWVNADATQLQQVLMNLCTNAWHALPEGRGHIEVGCTLLPADSPLRLRAADLPESATGPCAHLWVRDDGEGMDPATLDRIFDPFFTTKPVGQGTGLGLSVVHGIVRGHRGAVVVDSSLAGGSTFHLLLPLAPEPEPEPAVPDAPALPDGSAASPPKLQPESEPESESEQPASQRVLYVDDDEVMLLMVQRLLEREGYRVAVCSVATQALTGMRDGSMACDLVISDYNMPELSGIELARQLAALRPGLPIIITSGFVTDELRAQAAAVGVRAMLKKERTLEELAGLVRQVFFDTPLETQGAGLA